MPPPLAVNVQVKQLVPLLLRTSLSSDKLQWLTVWMISGQTDQRSQFSVFGLLLCKHSCCNLLRERRVASCTEDMVLLAHSVYISSTQQSIKSKICINEKNQQVWAATSHLWMQSASSGCFALVQNLTSWEDDAAEDRKFVLVKKFHFLCCKLSSKVFCFFPPLLFLLFLPDRHKERGKKDVQSCNLILAKVNGS